MSKFNLLVENNFKSILLRNRIFYPKNFDLSDEFKTCLNKEIASLKKKNPNLTTKDAQKKLIKALNFLLTS